jgi:hypothetical protein
MFRAESQLDLFYPSSKPKLPEASRKVWKNEVPTEDPPTETEEERVARLVSDPNAAARLAAMIEDKEDKQRPYRRDSTKPSIHKIARRTRR